MEPVLFIIPGACSFGSLLALEWSGAAYKVGITTAEIRASKAFHEINPTGKVGALKDGANVIGENLAILLYLADKYSASDMCPKVGSYERAQVYQWLSYLSSTLHPAFSQALFPKIFMQDEHVTEFKQGALGRLSKVLAHIDNSLAKNNFFIGKSPTIVDAQAYGLLRWGRGFHGQNPVIDLNQFTHIIKFLAVMEDKQEIKNALAIESSQIDSLVNSRFSGYFTF